MTSISRAVATTVRTWMSSVQPSKLKKCLLFVVMLCAARGLSQVPQMVQTLKGRMIRFIFGFLLDPKITALFSKKLPTHRSLTYKAEDSYKKAMDLVEMAENDPMHPLEEAQKAAWCIQEPCRRDEVFMRILKIQARVNSEAAKDMLDVIDDPEIAAQTLIEIIKIEATQNLETARATIASIEDPELQQRACLEIFKTEAPLRPLRSHL